MDLPTLPRERRARFVSRRALAELIKVKEREGEKGKNKKQGQKEEKEKKKKLDPHDLDLDLDLTNLSHPNSKKQKTGRTWPRPHCRRGLLYLSPSSGHEKPPCE